MLWVTVFGVIIIPLVGWLINALITKKIDDIDQRQKEDKLLLFTTIDKLRSHLEENYVFKPLYEQAMKFSDERSDEKFKSLLSIMNKQFENVEDKIEGIRELIIKNIDSPKKAG